MSSFAEAVLVIVVLWLALKNCTLKKEKELLLNQLCRVRDKEDERIPELAPVQAKQEIAEIPRSETDNYFFCPNFESVPSALNRWTYTAPNTSCPDCGCTVFEMRTYGGPLEYADTHCAQCGKLIRRFDAA